MCAKCVWNRIKQTLLIEEQKSESVEGTGRVREQNKYAIFLTNKNQDLILKTSTIAYFSLALHTVHLNLEVIFHSKIYD